LSAGPGGAGCAPPLPRPAAACPRAASPEDAMGIWRRGLQPVCAAGLALAHSRVCRGPYPITIPSPHVKICWPIGSSRRRGPPWPCLARHIISGFLVEVGSAPRARGGGCARSARKGGRAWRCRCGGLSWLPSGRHHAWHGEVTDMETCTSGAIWGSPGGLGTSPRPGERLDVSGRAALCLQRAHTHGLRPTPAVLVRY